MSSCFTKLHHCVKYARSSRKEKMTMKNPVWIVHEVEPHEDYTLLLTFANGEKKIYNARPLLEKAIYSQLKSPAFFLSAKVACGTVVWNDDLDIAPEHLYECSESVDV